MGGGNHRLEDKVIHTVLIPVSLLCLRVHLLAQSHQWLCVGLNVQIEMRDRCLGCKQPVSNDLTHRRKLDSLILSSN